MPIDGTGIQWLRERGSIIGIVGLISGVLAGIGIPIWKDYWVDAPRLRIELNGITREIDPGTVVSIDEDIFSILFPPDNYSFLFRQRPIIDEITLANVNRALEDRQRDLAVLPDQLDELQNGIAEINKLRPQTLSMTDVRRLNFPLSDEVSVNEIVFSQNDVPRAENLVYFQDIIGQFSSGYMGEHNHVQTLFNNLKTQLPRIRQSIDSLVSDLERNKSYFKVTAVIINSGRSSMSIKEQGLMRVYIGQDNYVDLKLRVKDYINVASIS